MQICPKFVSNLLTHFSTQFSELLLALICVLNIQIHPMLLGDTPFAMVTHPKKTISAKEM